MQRVVITSSVVGNSDTSIFDQVSTPDTRRPVPTEITDPYVAYSASKHPALLATNEFVAEKKPHFDVNVMPGFVIGRKLLAENREDVLAGSNMQGLRLVVEGVVSQAVTAAAAHIDDVAYVHVEALKLPGKGRAALLSRTTGIPTMPLASSRTSSPRHSRRECSRSLAQSRDSITSSTMLAATGRRSASRPSRPPRPSSSSPGSTWGSQTRPRLQC